MFLCESYSVCNRETRHAISTRLYAPCSTLTAITTTNYYKTNK